MTQLLLGCDPELFVREKETNRFVSAHDLLPGTKEKPHPVLHGAIQVDGVAAEFNTTPCDDVNDWNHCISQVIKQLQGKLGEKYILEICPAVVFDPEYFATLPEDVRRLGCNMDYNGWTAQPNEAPAGDSTTLRTASGHIHFGFSSEEDVRNSEYIEDCAEFAKQLDFFAGMLSLLWDNDPRRRSLYGQAGAFRPKVYGMEWRVLSNRWLSHPSLIKWVYWAGRAAFNSLVTKNFRATDRFGNLAQRVINGNEYEFVQSDEFKKDVWPYIQDGMGTGFQLTWPKW